jgi:uncharacterized protein YbjT (DUF2867 family)
VTSTKKSRNAAAWRARGRIDEYSTMSPPTLTRTDGKTRARSPLSTWGCAMNDGRVHHGAIYRATGPAALDAAARAALVAKVTGKSFGFVAVTADQHREGLVAAVCRLSSSELA